ncbi:hypothetical protein pb186bvf_002636 [Paramecium bursaria]
MAEKQVDKYIYKTSQDNMVGHGTFGVVYKARDQKTGQQYAIKVIPKSKVQASPKNMEGLTNEINILKQLKSPNIVQMVDVLETSNNFYIVQELCDGGDLAKLLKQKKKLTYQEVFNMIIDLLNGFAELLINGFIHRDLKPANILISQGKFKLADFGFARAVDNFNQQLFVSYVGTPLYMSPQILKGQKYTTKSDIWSFGFIIYEALYGKTPWTAQSIPELVRNIETKKLEFPDEIAFVSQDLKTLIAKCLIPNEEQRISWQDFMKDPLFIQHFDVFKQMDYDLENKEKFILQNIRNHVDSAGVDIDTLFENIVRNNKRNLNLDEFSETLKQLDPSLSNFEVQYIFNKVDTKKQNFIDREEFRNWLITNGVRMSTYGPKQKFEQQVATKEVAMAVLRTLKLAVVQHNIDVKELFNKYELKISNQPLGYITMEGFTKMIRKIDPNAAEISILQAFRQFDHQNNSKIPFEQFAQTINDINV